MVGLELRRRNEPDLAVKATVVLADGWQGSDDLTAELQKWVKRQTAPYKYPRIIEYVDELPRTVNGKIRRAAIREQDAVAGEQALDSHLNKVRLDLTKMMKDFPEYFKQG